MKKLLNISVIAALAILPMAANAATGDIVSGDPAAASSVSPAQADNAVTASASPKYALAVEAATDTTNVATASYVKGAYNAAMKAINKVSDTANSAVKGVQVNGADLTLDANGKANVTVAEGTTNGTVAVNGADVAVHGLGSAAFVNTGDLADTANTYSNTTSGLTATTLQDAIDEVASTAGSAVQSVAEGSTNGTIDVDGTDVAVHGLGSAAFEDSTAFDAAGSASAVEGKLDDGASGYDIDAKTLKVQGADVLTGASLTDYAKKIGVTHTISSSTIAGTVPTVTVWGAETPGTAQITARITGATYTETAPTPANP